MIFRMKARGTSNLMQVEALLVHLLDQVAVVVASVAVVGILLMDITAEVQPQAAVVTSVAAAVVEAAAATVQSSTRSLLSYLVGPSTTDIPSVTSP